MNDILINFRIPTDLKHDFSSVCRVNHTTMTSELIRFVKSYRRPPIFSSAWT